MILATQNFYAQWRARFRDGTLLRDEQFPAERLVQAIWQHQRLRRGELKTTGGQSVRVFHPGFANLEGGPDFRGAVLQIGGGAPCSGDVEVDLRAAGWRAHGHDRNPNFQKVLLHVIWDVDGGHTFRGQERFPGTRPPVLSIKDAIDAPLAELSLALENESLRFLPETLRGRCCAPLRELPESILSDLLYQAAQVRFETRAAHMRACAKGSGWEQALWEHLFRALGYKHNVWPMQHLAEQRTRLLGLPEKNRDAMLRMLQARLLGVSGLLPSELSRVERGDNAYLRSIWDVWWRDRDTFSDVILPRAAWRFHGLRPANHPQRRLALASHWLADAHFISRIEKWIAARKDKTRTYSKLLRDLMGILQVERDDFWSWHFTFKSARLKRQQPLLGEGRATDLAVNVIFPWLWIRAVEGHNEMIKEEVERRYFAWPPAEDNSILKLARQRLLGTSEARVLKTAAAQQGLIQIVRDFCEHSNAVCDNCRFPELVREKLMPQR